MSAKRKRISRLLKGAGVLLLAGPLLVSKINACRPTGDTYTASDPKAIKCAEAYNRNYMSGKACRPYKEMLDQSGTGIMGAIEIPSIGLRAPIYHGTGDGALQNGIGHDPESTLPVGGTGCRCILTGHRGLPGRELFLRLDEMEKGNGIVLNVAGERLCYKVTHITVISPEEADKLVPVEGKDMVTLVTCTPFGIHTKRLIVDGERCENLKGEKRRVLSKRGGVLLCVAAALKGKSVSRREKDEKN